MHILDYLGILNAGDIWEICWLLSKEIANKLDRINLTLEHEYDSLNGKFTIWSAANCAHSGSVAAIIGDNLCGYGATQQIVTTSWRWYIALAGILKRLPLND